MRGKLSGMLEVWAHVCAGKVEFGVHVAVFHAERVCLHLLCLVWYFSAVICVFHRACCAAKVQTCEAAFSFLHKTNTS